MNSEEKQESPRTGLDNKEWEVHKFGGTSVQNKECFERVAGIVEEQIGINQLGFHNSSSSTSNRTFMFIEDSTNNTQSNRNESISIATNGKCIAVVVSAMGGKPKVTDLLLSTVKAASERKNEEIEETMQQIFTKHETCINELALHSDQSEHLKSKIQKDLQDIKQILKTVSLLKWEAKRIAELVAGYGELWSTQILAALLNRRIDRQLGLRAPSTVVDSATIPHFVFVDARRFIYIDESTVPSPLVCWEKSLEQLNQVYTEESKKMKEKFKDFKRCLHLVITGFVASNVDGVCTTLGRDGSDYSASIVGKLLNSKAINIWTDVNGVLSADPRRVPEAYVIPFVSFNEAMELAYFGAKVIHPKTMQPAISCDPPIPIYIRNTFNASLPGTQIFTTSTTHSGDKCVCGFTSIEKMALVNVEGGGLIGVHGISRRLFGTLESLSINVVLISQASSEHTITFATVIEQAYSAKTAIEEEFRNEILNGHISAIEITEPCSVIAAVGDGMFSTTGVAGRFFSALGDAKINILAISQGSSERNISAVVHSRESTKALRAVHAAFRLSHTVVRIGIAGMNELGYMLLELLESRREFLRTVFEIDVQICALLVDSSSKDVVTLANDIGNHSITSLAYDMLTNESEVEDSLLNSLQLSNVVQNQLDKAPPVALKSGNIENFDSFVQSYDCAHNIIIDCTSDEKIAKQHPEWLSKDIDVISANNMGISGSKEVRKQIYEMESKKGSNSNAKYLTEITVGGALPIIRTLRDLLNSGDKIRRVTGILSVSMSYIFHRIAPPPALAQSFSFDKDISNGAIEGSLYMTSKIAGGVSSSFKACSFSTAVKEAIALGLMEEDPLKDLSNEYTARVLMVLAKELGIAQGHDVEKIQLNSDQLIVDVEEKHLDGEDGKERIIAVKKPLKSVDKYEDIAEQLDLFMHDRVVKAAKAGCVPRHISSIDVSTGEVYVKIIDVPCNHVFAITPPSCECVRFYTKTHNRYPLVIQGPSAGTDSVARGLLAELLNLMQPKIGVRTATTLSHTNSSAYLS